MTCFCFCSVYNGKPHAIGKGLCTGVAWASSLYELERSAWCETCHCNQGQFCEVADGQESVSMCSALEVFIDQGSYPKYCHPANLCVEDILEKRFLEQIQQHKDNNAIVQAEYLEHSEEIPLEEMLLYWHNGDQGD